MPFVPRYRTGEYGLWRACERLNVRPPKVQAAWEDNDVMTQAMILSYNFVREHDEMELLKAQIGAK